MRLHLDGPGWADLLGTGFSVSEHHNWLRAALGQDPVGRAQPAALSRPGSADRAQPAAAGSSARSLGSTSSAYSRRNRS